jgi:hypothetical protein
MTFTDPPDWAGGATVTEADLDTYLSGDLQYLYDNLPTRVTLFHNESLVTAGNAIVGAILATQAHNAVYYQSTSADADSFTHAFVLAEGTYTLYIYGQTRTNGAKIDWYVDGASIATGQDWYAASNTADVTKSIASVVISVGGRHVLTGTVNGRNASNSTGWDIRLTKMYFLPASD